MEKAWKIRLIEESNPEWKNLYDELIEKTGFPLPKAPTFGFAGMTEWGEDNE